MLSLKRMFTSQLLPREPCPWEGNLDPRDCAAKVQHYSTQRKTFLYPEKKFIYPEKSIYLPREKNITLPRKKTLLYAEKNIYLPREKDITLPREKLNKYKNIF